MLLLEFLRKGLSELEALYPSAEAKSILLMLTEARIGTKSYTHIIEPTYEIPPKAVEPLEEDLLRLTRGEPIQYVIGTAEFCGYTFKVGKGVLIPRPETELLVKEAVKIAGILQRARIPYGKNAEPVRVLDLCTGSGCIAWTVALKVPGVRVRGVDNSDEALNIARGQNFQKELKAAGAVPPDFVKGDVLCPETIEGEYDLILSNPPYIMEKEKAGMRPNVLSYEPSEALFVPDDDPLLFYRAIADISMRVLAKDGKCLTEINELLGEKTADLFRKKGFGHVSIERDFFDKDRFIFYSK